MLKRTPLIAIYIAGLISIAVALIFEIPSRPLTTGQTVLLYMISLLPAIGFALYFDPSAIEAKRKYSEINFYEEKK